MFVERVLNESHLCFLKERIREFQISFVVQVQE
jgi:hypothetical protein